MRPSWHNDFKPGYQAATAAAAANPLVVSKCNTGGCWYWNSTIQTQYISSGVAYGYGSHLLGTMYLNLTWTLSASILTSVSGKAKATGATEYVQWLGVLSNSAAGAPNGGSVIHSCSEVAGPIAVSPNQWVTSPTRYCTLGDNHNYDHNMLGEYSFEVGGVPGFFYLFARSDVAHSATKANDTFNSPITLPGGSYGSGWEAGSHDRDGDGDGETGTRASGGTSWPTPLHGSLTAHDGGASSARGRLWRRPL